MSAPKICVCGDKLPHKKPSSHVYCPNSKKAPPADTKQRHKKCPSGNICPFGAYKAQYCGECKKKGYSSRGYERPYIPAAAGMSHAEYLESIGRH
jgi:hypothetical protein